MKVERLSGVDEAPMEALLSREPVVNLFLIGFLAAHPAEHSWWYGLRGPKGRISALVLVLPGRLAVPYAPDPEDARALGAHLSEQHTPCLLVGPRLAVDAMKERWFGDLPVQRSHDQHLYSLERGALPPEWDVPDPEGYRPALYTDREAIARGAAEMELEDIGIDPRQVDPNHHISVVSERIRAGRTSVIERKREIVFQINVGTSHPLGCQLGGTWVPPSHRGQGLAKAGVAATCRRLLLDHPRVTLHVNEANTPAVRAYERVGFSKIAPFRLVVP